MPERGSSVDGFLIRSSVADKLFGDETGGFGTLSLATALSLSLGLSSLIGVLCRRMIPDAYKVIACDA